MVTSGKTIKPEKPGPALITESSEPPLRLSDDEFRVKLEEMIPHLRAFGRSLAGKRDLADDLVQDTLMRAWAARSRFQAGTNMRAWTFVILRNLFLSQMRRSKFVEEWDDAVAERLTSDHPPQQNQLYLMDVRRALMCLPDAQREALVLVGAGGFSYEEAAEICACSIGTVKSRVARARVALKQVLNSVTLPNRGDSPASASFAGALIWDDVEKAVEKNDGG